MDVFTFGDLFEQQRRLDATLGFGPEVGPHLVGGLALLFEITFPGQTAPFGARLRFFLEVVGLTIDQDRGEREFVRCHKLVQKL